MSYKTVQSKLLVQMQVLKNTNVVFVMTNMKQLLPNNHINLMMLLQKLLVLYKVILLIHVRIVAL